MGLYSKILVAVDGSDASLNALSESIKLSYWARGCVCAIYVAPSYEGDLSLTGVKDLQALFNEPYEIALAKIKETVEKTDASIEALCETGEPSEKIAEYAETKDFDLIVTGIRKKNTLNRIFNKGVAEKITGVASKDVLIIPQNTSIGWDKILISTGSLKNIRIAKKIIEIAKTYGGKSLLLAVSGGNNKRNMVNTEEVINGIKQLSSGIAIETFIKKGDAAKVIADIALEHNADLIIMGASLKKSIKFFF
ncbi:universal stress protein [Desulfobacterium sp. N47]|uniref:UspA domain-containing protein n=1 Tax=uncultured Desulfobacterium sp. TaxID=201089 RepID=E1YDI6_9BACT|nr:hypothetical protein N47_G39540 [uncultured Desulfobacterium sp.]